MEVLLRRIVSEDPLIVEFSCVAGSGMGAWHLGDSESLSHIGPEMVGRTWYYVEVDADVMLWEESAKVVPARPASIWHAEGRNRIVGFYEGVYEDREVIDLDIGPGESFVTCEILGVPESLRAVWLEVTVPYDGLHLWPFEI